jgi:hypothetical protein
MSEQSIVLLACLALVAVLAILIYVLSRSQAAALSTICELRRGLDQILANNRNQEQTMKMHGHVLNDAHKRICAVSKGLEKRPS